MPLLDVLIDCPHTDTCAGCPAIALPYAKQLENKADRVGAAFARYPDLSRTPRAEIAPAEPLTGYRTRLKWVVSERGQVGLFAREGDHVVVDIPGCVVAPEVAKSVAGVLRKLLASPPKEAPKLLAPTGKGGVLRGVDVRVVEGKEGGVLVTLLVAAAVTDVEQKAASALLIAKAPAIRGVAISIQGPTPQMLGASPRFIGGTRNLGDPIGTVKVPTTFGSFVQAHRGQAARVEALLAAALDDVKPKGRAAKVLDLYGGSGAFGLALAARGAEVLVVDSFAPAVRLAEDAAKAQKLTLTARAGDASAVLDALYLELEKSAFDLVVVNPPRRGLAPSVRAALAKLEPKRVAYVSCDPDTLARDLDHLARLGLATKRVHPIDMIPLTDEVEDVAILAPSAPSVPRVLASGEGFVVVDKGPHEATEGTREHGVTLTSRMRAQVGYFAAAHRLDVGTSGACLFATSKEQLVVLTKALETAEKRYLTLVRGVVSKKGSVAHPLRDGRATVPARTRWQRLAVIAGHSLVAAMPEGSGHQQVRRHFAAIGHPVLGDDRHGDAPSNRYFVEKYGLDRPFLHLARLSFAAPDAVVAEAPLPGDLAVVLARMGNTQQWV